MSHPIGDDPSELLDIVDEHDHVIGTILRIYTEQVMKAKSGYFRASEGFLVNDRGQLWVPRRTAHKKIAPNALDYSVSGHVASGQTYLEAMQQECREELNLDLPTERLRLVKQFPPTPGLPPFHRAFYVFYGNDVPPFNPDDFSEYYWLTPQELLDWLQAGEPAKLSVPETVQYLLAHPEYLQY